MPRKVISSCAVKWLSEEVNNKENISNSFHYYEKFQFKKLIAGIGDYVLVSNADSAEPDTEEGCDPARILSLYEDPSNNNDPYRARVQWFSHPSDLPSSCFVNTDHVNFMEREVLEDHRPFNMDVSIETFFKKCSIRLIFTKETNEINNLPQYHYFCRYRLTALSKRKVQIEPVREEERRALELLRTPNKQTPLKNNIPKTPNSLIKRMNRVSLSEQRSWSVSKNDGNKILLKRALLTDKSEKDSPKKTPSKLTANSSVTETPSRKKLESRVIEELLSTELIENSDVELPTLIIKQYVPSTPKRKQSISKTTDETPKKVLIFEEDDEKETVSSRSRRVTRTPINYMETDVSPVKRTPKKVVQKTKVENSDVLIFEQDAKRETLSTPSRRMRTSMNYMEPEVSPIKRTPRKVVKKTKVENSTVLTFEGDDAKETLSTRSRRVTKTPMNYMETEVSPVKRTPRKVVQKTKGENSDDDFHPEPHTPKTSRTPKKPKATPNTRTPRMRRIVPSQLTPTLHSRAHAIKNTEAFLKENKSLPGREQQMEEILSFVRTKLLDGVSGCMYISGVPGTGKTATVCAALKILKEEVDLPNFQLVEVNGMRIAEPRQAYVQIYKQLTGKSVVWEQACTLLEKRFTNPGPRRTPTVLLVDELDALCTRRQDVLYSIMEWAAHNTALLTVLAVANTMDLPERALASRVASRLGLTRLTFPPYTHTQLQRIVATRLADADVTPDAVQLIARKVAAVSGDARRALALCGRALELAGGARAGLGEVQRALGEAASSAAVRAVRACAPADRLMLRAVAAEVERTGSEETTISRALMTAAALVALEGRPYRTAPSIRPPTPSQALAICMRLAAQRLLLLEPKAAEPKLLLNISADDVHYATRQINV